MGHRVVGRESVVLAGLVVYVSPNPFKRRPRSEYKYGPVYVEAEDPVYAIVDESYYDNYGLVLVPDYYAAWPQARLLPGAESYEELLQGLEEAAAKYCRVRGEPHYCKRLVYRAIPARGEHGAWRFTASPGETLLHTYLAIRRRLAELQEKHIAIDKLYILIDSHEPLNTLLALLAATAIAAEKDLATAMLVADPKPVPPSRTILEVTEHPTPATIHAATPATVEIHIQPHTPPQLARQLQNLERKLRKQVEKGRHLHEHLEHLAGIYIEHTRLSKKEVGGTIVHPYTIELQTTLLLINPQKPKQ